MCIYNVVEKGFQIYIACLFCSISSNCKHPLLTGAALELLRLQGFNNERVNDPNIAIVITDGYSRDKTATRQQVTYCY